VVSVFLLKLLSKFKSKIGESCTAVYYCIPRFNLFGMIVINNCFSNNLHRGVALRNSLIIKITSFWALILVVSCNHKSSPGQQTQKVTIKSASQGPEQVTENLQECPLHKAPKEICFICDSTLRDKSRLWCKDHDRYEDRCFDCHPEIQEKTRLYCTVHGLYEDECMICHPEVVKEQKK
jgi:hypothetical protein